MCTYSRGVTQSLISTDRRPSRKSDRCEREGMDRENDSEREGDGDGERE